MKNYLTSLVRHLPRRRAMVIVTCALLVSMGAGVAIYYNNTATPAPTLQARMIVHQQARTYADLSASDIHLYSQAFLAAKNGDHSKVDALLIQTESQVLLGHVLAERYLHESYRTNRQELSLWLENFSDHPQTSRIAHLAGRKGLSNAKEYSDLSPLLTGRGYTDHLGTSALPASWYQGLSAWRKGAYAQAAASFSQTARTPSISDWHKAAGYFWAARAYGMLKQKENAEIMLQAASKYQVTLYGILATRMLGDSVTLAAASPYMSAKMEDAPEYVRARALVAVGQTALAESEIRKLFMQIDRAQRPEILAMAGELGLANLQIRLSRMDELNEDERLFASYPMPQNIIKTVTVIDPSLVLAVARQESAFKAEVQSPAGARGLMQVMPTTAQHVIKNPQFASLNEDAITTYGHVDLMQADTNVQVGASYLAMLASKPFISGNLIEMLAAYNAGPGNVASWNKTAKNITDPLLYIESIPFGETRNYVVQVLTHYVIYQSLMGKPDRVIEALAHQKFPYYHG